jgi:NHLM bacteriocin system ABC transporter peptidase/ATP-binding protein
MTRLRSTRRSVPTVLQMQAVECGAASLAMVLAYHGRWAPLDEVRKACGVSRDGSKAANVVAAAKTFGLTSAAYRKEPDGLRGLPLPSILHWKFNHFVVCEGFSRHGVHLNDPAVGKRTVSWSEVDASFTGIVMTFTPNADFRRDGRRSGLWSTLRTRLQGLERGLAFAMAAGLLLVVPSLIAPAFMRIFVDDVLVKGLTGWVNPLIYLMIAAVAAGGALTWLQQLALLRVETKCVTRDAARFVWHALRLPVDFFSHRYPGEIGSRVALTDRIAQSISNDLANTCLAIVTVLFYGVMMWRYDLQLTAIAIGASLVSIAVMRATRNRRGELNRRMLQDQAHLMTASIGGLQSVETLKAMGGEGQFFARWAGCQARVSRAQQALRLQTDCLSVLPPFLMTMCVTLILGVGGRKIMDGHFSIGMLLTFQTLALAYLAPLQRVVDTGNTVQELRAQLERVDDVLDSETDPRTGLSVPARDATQPIVGDIEFRHVSFGYAAREPALVDGLSLRVRPGQRVALVGGSGSGKSTIAKLAAGIYGPWTGEILVDGRPLSQLGYAELSGTVAVVDQDVFLFEGTIRDNLTLWDHTVEERDVINAAVDACIHDDILARSGGYDAAVSEGGANFSGGQRQRLEIARALVSNPSVLILDEATSALDAASEKLIDDAIRRRGCTCLIVAHRLSTIRDCDEIIVLDHGRIAERGTHDELMHSAGEYAGLMAAEGT